MARGLLLLTFAFLVGVAAAIAFAAGLGVKVVVAGAVASIGILIAGWRKSWLAFAFFLAIFVTEEFLPRALLTVDLDPDQIILEGGRVAFPNPRITYLYSESVGIRGLYAVEALLLGLLAVFLFSALRRRQALPFTRDAVFMPMVLTLISLGVSAIISLFIFPDSTAKSAYRFDEVEIGLNADVAALVPYFQIKAWLYVYLSYALTRLVLVNQEMVRRLLVTVVASSIFIIIVGAWRVYQMKRGVYIPGAAYYDDATLFVLILLVCFMALGWSRRLFTRQSVWWQVPLVASCLLVLAVSPRRATWIGAGLCLLLVFALIPMRQRVRALMVGGVGGLALLLVTVGFGWQASSVSFEAVGQDASAVYRAALFYNLFQFEGFTLFGYGTTPLWNMPLVMGAFQFNFESVHSLYYWFILRTGLVGLGLFLYLSVRAIRSCWNLRRNAVAPWTATLAETLLIGLVLYLFLGLFHPVYAMARFAIFLGMLMGIAMAAVAINQQAQRHRAAQSQL